ncbi:MAG: N-acetylmuramoyl-L-alanine amidase [Mucilaginibacter polytrichastri]|nr:N-acetylmuramoyl-L-alanine amidase [Mucilaginibacter polytrichastri]
MKNAGSSFIFALCSFISFSIIAVGCASNPYAVTDRVYRQQVKLMAKSLREASPLPLTDSLGRPVPSYWVGTTNFGLRKPNYVIIHHTAQKSTEQTLKTFTMPKSQVSAHYVVGRDGKVYHMLNDYLRAWHAGNSLWGNDRDVNSASIGIEIDNNGFEPFSAAQISSLLSLLAKLKSLYGIPQSHFIGHADIAPGRKVDPSKYFPWKTLADHGFGYWYDQVLDTVPRNFSAVQAMRNIGYDTKDSARALGSFKLHFMPMDTLRRDTLSDTTRRIMNNLMKKYSGN